MRAKGELHSAELNARKTANPKARSHRRQTHRFQTVARPGQRLPSAHSASRCGQAATLEPATIPSVLDCALSLRTSFYRCRPVPDIYARLQSV